MTGPKPPPKWFLHIVRSKASSFKWEYPLLSLRSSSSFLRLLPRLLTHCTCFFYLFCFHNWSRCTLIQNKRLRLLIYINFIAEYFRYSDCLKRKETPFSILYHFSMTISSSFVVLYYLTSRCTHNIHNRIFFINSPTCFGNIPPSSKSQCTKTSVKPVKIHIFFLPCHTALRLVGQ